MSLLHICNTFFEKELESPSTLPLIEWMRSNPIVRQLQRLPLLYAAPEDLVLVSDLPPHPDPRLHLIDFPLTVDRIEDWGASEAIDAWSKKRKIPYRIPDWETVRAINSKIFSFTHSPSLPGAALLPTEKEALLWIEKTPGPKVLKTPFGTAGRGHLHIPGKGNLASFLKAEIAKGLPLIGEPWVGRILDFSTQWKDGVLLGATTFENNPHGSYRSTLAGPKIFGAYEWALEEHLQQAMPILETIRNLGFFGHIGIDAFIYTREGKQVLHPIVEINARKTMSWAALRIQKTRPEHRLKFSFSPSLGISTALL